MADFDKLLKQLAKEGKSYAEWQGERYPVVASHKESLKREEMNLSRSIMRRVEIQKGE